MSRPKITQAQFALRLYRGILRSHRARLPADMRALGDRYVRQEFKAHKDAAPEHLRKFFPEWLAYLEALQEASPDELQNIGKDMSQEQQDATERLGGGRPLRRHPAQVRTPDSPRRPLHRIQRQDFCTARCAKWQLGTCLDRHPDTESHSTLARKSRTQRGI
eukprot:g1661.t1